MFGECERVYSVHLCPHVGRVLSIGILHMCSRDWECMLVFRCDSFSMCLVESLPLWEHLRTPQVWRPLSPHYNSLPVATALTRWCAGGFRCSALGAQVCTRLTPSGCLVGPGDRGMGGTPWGGGVRSGTVGCRQGLQACHCSPVWLLHCGCGGPHVWGSPQHFPGGWRGCLSGGPAWALAFWGPLDFQDLGLLHACFMFSGAGLWLPTPYNRLFKKFIHVTDY